MRCMMYITYFPFFPVGNCISNTGKSLASYKRPTFLQIFTGARDPEELTMYVGPFTFLCDFEEACYVYIF